MRNPSNPEEPSAPNSGLTRRSVLGGVAALAATPLLAGAAHAAPPPQVRYRRIPSRGLVRGVGAGRPRYLHASVGLPDGRVVVLGGYGSSEATRSRAAAAPMASVQVYDPRFNAWIDLAPMRLARARHAAVALPDGRIAVLGGIFTSPLSSVEVYDPRTDAWSDAPSLPSAMFDHVASVCTSGLLVSGGQNGVAGLLLPFPG